MSKFIELHRIKYGQVAKIYLGDVIEINCDYIIYFEPTRTKNLEYLTEEDREKIKKINSGDDFTTVYIARSKDYLEIIVAESVEKIQGIIQVGQ